MTRRVAEVMAKPEGVLREDMTFQQVARALVEENVSSLPVVDETGHVLGMVSEADLIVRDESFGVPWLPTSMKRSIREKLGAATASALMTTPAVTVQPDTELTKAARCMRKHAIKRLPVCDDDGHLLGMLSRGDLLLEFVRPDEVIAEDLAELWRTMSLPVHDPRYSVADGVATIEGRLEHRVHAEEIIDRVHEIPGIVDVVDRLSWDDGDDVFAQGSVPWLGLASVAKQA